MKKNLFITAIFILFFIYLNVSLANMTKESDFYIENIDSIYGYNTNLLKLSSLASDDVYLNDSPDRNLLSDGFYRVKFFNDEQLQTPVLVMQKNTDEVIITIGFRGTETDDGDDVLNDITAFNKEFTVNYKTVYYNNKPVITHYGFARALNQFLIKEKEVKITVLGEQIPLNVLISNTKLNNKIRFFIYGHSLGGAVATLYAATLLERGISSDRLIAYTFGAPSVGNQEFVDKYDSNLNLFRFRNKYDPVPFAGYLGFILGENISIKNTITNKKVYLSYLNDFLIGYMKAILFEDWKFKHIGRVFVYDSNSLSYKKDPGGQTITDPPIILSEHSMKNYIVKSFNCSFITSEKYKPYESMKDFEKYCSCNINNKRTSIYNNNEDTTTYIVAPDLHSFWDKSEDGHPTSSYISKIKGKFIKQDFQYSTLTYMKGSKPIRKKKDINLINIAFPKGASKPYEFTETSSKIFDIKNSDAISYPQLLGSGSLLVELGQYVKNIKNNYICFGLKIPLSLRTVVTAVDFKTYRVNYNYMEIQLVEFDHNTKIWSVVPKQKWENLRSSDAVDTTSKLDAGVLIDQSKIKYQDFQNNSLRTLNNSDIYLKVQGSFKTNNNYALLINYWTNRKYTERLLAHYLAPIASLAYLQFDNTFHLPLKKVSFDADSFKLRGIPYTYYRPALLEVNEDCLLGVGCTDQTGKDYYDIYETRYYNGFIEGFYNNYYRKKRSTNNQFLLSNRYATRAEAVLLSFLYNKIPEKKHTLPYFSDIPTTHDLFNIIQTAKDLEIVHGYKNGQFKPYKHITRVEAAKIILKAFNLDLYIIEGPRKREWSEDLFNDLDKSKWWYKYVRAAYLYEILDGLDNNQFGPEHLVTRSQLLKMVFQAKQVSNENLITAGHYREPKIEDYSESNSCPVGKIIETSLSNGNYILKADYLDSNNHSLSYYWIADGGKFLNLSQNENEVEWIPPTTPLQSHFTIQVWVQDGHGLMAIGTETITINKETYSIELTENDFLFGITNQVSINEIDGNLTLQLKEKNNSKKFLTNDINENKYILDFIDNKSLIYIPPIIEHDSLLPEQRLKNVSSPTWEKLYGDDLDIFLYRGHGSDNGRLSFNITIDRDISEYENMTLILSVYDVDYNNTEALYPERDSLYVNNRYIGMLSGANDSWSINVFNISNSYLNYSTNDNSNKISIDINTLMDKPVADYEEGWGVQVDYGIITAFQSSENGISIDYSNIEDNLVDENADDINDYITFNIPILYNPPVYSNSDVFTLNAVLTDLKHNLIMWSLRQEIKLSQGYNNISLDFNGEKIVEYGQDGPYILTNLVIYNPQNPTINAWNTQSYLTKTEYKVSDFNQDIEIKPIVVSVSPNDGAFNISIDTKIKILFNKKMDSNSINTNSLYLKDTSNNIVPSIIYYNDESKAAILDPLNSLQQGSKYIATITNNVKDVDGNRLTYTKNWGFTVTNKIYYTEGYWISDIIDTSFEQIYYKSITFDADIPDNSFIHFQIRSANDPSEIGLSNWYGPNSTEDIYSNADNEINAIHNNNRYIQVKVILGSNNSGISPSLRNLSISYSNDIKNNSRSTRSTPKILIDPLPTDSFQSGKDYTISWRIKGADIVTKTNIRFGTELDLETYYSGFTPTQSGYSGRYTSTVNIYSPVDTVYYLIICAEIGYNNYYSNIIPINIKANNKKPIVDRIEGLTVIPISSIGKLEGICIDEDNDILSYRWEIIEEPINSILSIDNPSKSSIKYTPTVVGKYIFNFFADDGQIESDPCPITINVVDLDPNNLTPIADAGQNNLYDNNVQIYLNASQSFDPDGDTLTYHWEQTQGYTVAINYPEQQISSFYVTKPGNYSFRLIVTDTSGLSDMDSVTATVIIEPKINMVKILPDNASNGDILSFNWQIDSPKEVNKTYVITGKNSNPLTNYEFISNTNSDISNTYSYTILVNSPEDITYHYMAVAHIDGRTYYSEIYSINIDGNSKPKAIIFSELFTNVGEEVILDGSYSIDENNDPLDYNWEMINAPEFSNINLVNDNESQAIFTPMVPGQYDFSLIVNDGFINSDEKKVTVFVAGNREESIIENFETKNIDSWFGNVNTEFISNKCNNDNYGLKLLISNDYNQYFKRNFSFPENWDSYNIISFNGFWTNDLIKLKLVLIENSGEEYISNVLEKPSRYDKIKIPLNEVAFQLAEDSYLDNGKLDINSMKGIGWIVEVSNIDNKNTVDNSVYIDDLKVSSTKTAYDWLMSKIIRLNSNEHFAIDQLRNALLSDQTAVIYSLSRFAPLKARKIIESILKYQNIDGSIPEKLINRSFFSLPRLIDNAWFAMALLEYEKRTGDNSFSKRVDDIVSWIETKKNTITFNDTVYEYYFDNQDINSPNIIYTIDNFTISDLFIEMEIVKQDGFYKKKHEDLDYAIQELFWAKEQSNVCAFFESYDYINNKWDKSTSSDYPLKTQAYGLLWLSKRKYLISLKEELISYIESNYHIGNGYGLSENSFDLEASSVIAVALKKYDYNIDSTYAFLNNQSKHGGIKSNSEDINSSILSTSWYLRLKNELLFESATGSNLELEVLNGDLISLNTLEPSFITQNSNTPINMIYGLIDMKIKSKEKSGTVQVNIQFPKPIPKEYKWYKYSNDNDWYEYNNYQFNSDNDLITITFKDGSEGDSDNIENGIIVDLSALAKQQAPNESLIDNTQDSNCFISILE